MSWAAIICVQQHSPHKRGAYAVHLALAFRVLPDSGLARVSQRQLARLAHLGDHKEAARYLRELIDAKDVELVEPGSGRRPDTYRLVGVPCYGHQQAAVVGRLQDPTTAADSTSPWGAQGAPQRGLLRGAQGTPPKKRQEALTPQQRLAMLAAEANHRPDDGAPDGDGHHSGSAGSALRPTAPKPKQAGADIILPFKADRSLPPDDGEPSTQHYAAAPSAATGGPFSNPGRLFEPEPEHDPARWTR